MKLTILTPEEEIFTGEIKAIKVPGVVGEFEVLNNHAPMVSLLQAGNVKYTAEDGKSTTFSIQNGFVEILNNEIALLVQGYTSG
ncbi:MAG: ATP synthase F1 subunit epsilon [Bacteroidota bacterium]